MKRLPRPLLVVAVAFLTACSSSSDAPSTPTQPTTPTTTSTANTMSATIDGVAWTASATSVTSVALGPLGTLLLATGVTLDNGIGFYIRPGQLGAQTLGTVSATENLALLTGPPTTQPAGANWSTDATTKGVVTLTINTTNRVAGTFSFDAKANSAALSPQMRKVTNGTFDIRF